MNVGSLVQYTAREGEDPSPAIVMRVWPEGTIQLHVFHFESTTHIRAAHPSQVVSVVDGTEIQEILEDFTAMGRRMLDLESEIEQLRREIRQQRQGQEAPDTPQLDPDTSDLVADAIIAPTVIPIDDEVAPEGSPWGDSPSSDNEPAVESTRHQKKRAAWPR